MTEARVAYQTAFVGLATDQVAGDVPERCRVMLMEEPETRKDYMLAYVRYLGRYHSLDYALSHSIESVSELIQFLDRVPSFRTVANRIQELFNKYPELRPPPEVMAKRQRQRRQGRIK